MNKTFFAVGAILAALGVAAGAFGAHALKHTLPPDRLNQFEVAVRYQMYHALALMIVGVTAERLAGLASVAGWLFLMGTIVFCTSVYGLSLGAPRWF